MKTQFRNSFKKILSVIFLTLSIGSISLAQSSSGPSGGPGGSFPTPVPYPNVTWPYSVPSPKSAPSTVPTIDANSAVYLPYLPWIATNVAALVNYSDFFYQLEKNNNGNGSNVPYNNTQTTTANNLLSQTQINNMTTSAGQTQKNIQEFLSFDPNNALFFAKLPTIEGTDTMTPCQGSSCPTPPDDSAFNADTLFGITGYPAQDINGKPTSQAQTINNLILFLTNITRSLPDPGISTDKDQRSIDLGNGQVQNYLLKIRTLVALQSMALSNFNFLSQERAIIPNLGKNAQMQVIPAADKCDAPAQVIPDASQLQLDKYLLDRRLNNPCWYANMNTASPSAVARETLYVMVEIQRQLYETQMLNERVLATLSTMQMAMTQMGQGNLAIQANNVKGCLQNPKQCSIPGPS